MLVHPNARLLESFTDGMIWMRVPDVRLPDSGYEAIIRMLDNSDARLFGCSITEKRFRRNDTDARQPDARNIVAQFLNAFSIGLVLLVDYCSTIADLI